MTRENGMARKALVVDTNVWLDMEMPGDNYEQVREFVLTARAADARLGIAAHSLKDVYTLMQRRLKLENERDHKLPVDKAGPSARVVAWAVVEKILETAEVVGSDYMDACIATKQRSIHDDYEDDLVIAAAMRMKADFLVTSDAALLRHCPVAALSPADATKWLQAQEWAG